MAVSKKTRFEVFKRDSFTCQYCGAQAPNVVLQADHVHPSAKGGGDGIENLVTSCASCNSGKSDRLLSDDTAVAKQKAQLNELQARREQIEMMLQWKTGLAAIDDEAAIGVWDHLFALFGYETPEQVPVKFRKTVKKFGVELCLSACEAALNAYDDIAIAVEKFGGICNVMKRSKDDPDYGSVTRVRAAVMKSGKYCNHAQLESTVRYALTSGVNVESIVTLAWKERNWTAFMKRLAQLVDETVERRQGAME